MKRHDLFAIISKLAEIGISLSAQKDHNKLLENILLSAKELTAADGGTFYLVSERRTLLFVMVRTDSLGTKYLWSGTPSPAFPEIPLFDESGDPIEHTVVGYAVHHGTTVNIVDVYAESGFDFSGTRAFDERNHYRSRAMLTVPLKNHEQDVVAVLQLLNPKEQPGVLPYFTFEDQTIVESLASQAAVAMTNYQLIDELRAMFESLTHVIAEAIDEKSPVTGKHCKRVPIITQMLAEAVNHLAEGPLAGLRLSAEQMYELNIAALLHDCGKVTTPVHVVEKAEKLETIVNRIDLIDTRLAVMRAQERVRTLEQKLEGLAALTTWPVLEEREKQTLAQLQEDAHFLRKVNRGQERMSQEEQGRIQQIAERQWQDLAGESQPLLTADEVENLTIPHGTLTSKEREIIQNHVVMTIKMLEKIPYPRYLKNVPEIAGKHHEKLDGSGYPNGLHAEQISLRARILTIADIFEALTAPDRAYKEILPLSKALGIMDKMAERGEIDQELWKIFVSEKVYVRYGRQYLAAEQLDVQ